MPVFNAPFSNTRSVAEMIIAEIVMLSRQLGDRSREMHEGSVAVRSPPDCYEVRGKTLGIVGYGHIGSAGLASLAESLGHARHCFSTFSRKLPMGNANVEPWRLARRAPARERLRHAPCTRDAADPSRA